MGMIQITPGADYSGAGLANVISPLPTFEDALFACYLPGTAWNGAGGVAHDYSGQRGDLLMGTAAVSATGVGGAAAGYATTPFSTADLASGNDGFTWVGVIKVPTGSANAPVLNAGGGAPYAALHVLPATNQVSGYKVDAAGPAQALYTFLAALKGQYAFVHGRWTTAAAKAGLVNPAAGWVGAAGYATLVTSKGFFDSRPIRFLPSDGTGVGNPEISLAGFYSRELADSELAAVYTAARKAMRLQGIAI